MHKIFSFISEYLLHLDDSLVKIFNEYGAWVYGLLFAIVFLETGIVIMPFLPGDSLLFAAGALSGDGSLSVWLLFVLLFSAAVIGDTVNYWIGKKVGSKVYALSNSRWLKKEHLERTHRFYEKHGAKTIVLARFVPIIRTIAPFVAGVGLMHYRHFLTYNVLGALLWVGIFLFGGYYFGQLPFIQENFIYVVIGIILVSVLPPFYEVIKARREHNSTKKLDLGK